MKEKKIYFIVNQGAFFVSHRVDLAINAKKLGWNVKLLIGTNESLEMEAPALSKLDQLGISYQKLMYRPTGRNIFFELLGFVQLFWILFTEKPDVVHTVSPKGMLYGGFVARLVGIKSLVIAISGMGYLYTNKGGLLKKILLSIVDSITSYILSHSNKIIIVQNKIDFNFFINKNNVVYEEVKLISGSGVNLNSYKHIKSEGRKAIVFPARLLKDKGVVEFVDAVKELKPKFKHWTFILAGAANYDNPTAITNEQAEQWVNSGLVEWYGHVEDMIPVYEESDIVCLPSYREGMPKVLLEAAAAGKAIVTTDTIGCNEAIVNNVSGLLVPLKNVEKLVDALELLITNRDMRLNFGKNGRILAQEKFSIESVVEATFSAYNSLYGNIYSEK